MVVRIVVEPANVATIERGALGASPHQFVQVNNSAAPLPAEAVDVPRIAT